MSLMNEARGFSLLELLIVVAIISLVAAIAVPNLLAARRAANEGSAVSSLRTLFGANLTFAATAGDGDYAGIPSTVGVSSLEDLFDERLIDGAIASGAKGGYVFVGDWTPAHPSQLATFYFSANPSVSAGVVASGTKRYGVATDGVLKSDADAINLAVPFDAPSLAIATPLNAG
jgi:type IV pilus assembly protein PilA